MKKYIDINGNPIKGEMTVERMFDIACKQWQYYIDHDKNADSRVKRIIKESIKNRKEIIKTIKSSKSHMMGKRLDAQEIHFIAIVEGKAHCLKSMNMGVGGENGCDKIMFVFEKTYNRFNYEEFQTDVLSLKTGGLDCVWSHFNYEVQYTL